MPQATERRHHNASSVVQFLQSCQTLLEESTRRCGVALAEGHIPQIVEHDCHGLSISQFSVVIQALLEKGPRGRVVTLPTEGLAAQAVKRGSDAGPVAEGSSDGQALFEERLRRTIVAAIVSQLAQSMEGVRNVTPVAQLSPDHQALIVERLGHTIVALSASQHPSRV